MFLVGRALYAFAAVALVLLLSTLITLRPTPVASILHQLTPGSANETLRYAYATFLSTRVEDDQADDPYFTATRTLAYQLLQQPSTRTRLDVPFLVLVPPHVPRSKRRALVREGATVVPVDLLEPDDNWLSPGEERWIDQFAKLNLFNMTEYDRILYMDNDMLLTRPLDAIWDEAIVRQVQQTGTDKRRVRPDEAPLPATYQIVGVSDTGGGDHPFPPEESDGLNGGFFMLRPDARLFSYYRSIMAIPGRFDSAFMEQALLNYAHRRDGNMPWRAFEMGKWNCNWPNRQDLEGGAATLHDKFWSDGNRDWIDRKLVEMWWRVQGAMEGYWRAKNEN